MTQTYKTKKEIEAWLQTQGIRDYYLETDLSIIAQNNVDLSGRNLEFIPVKFKHAVGEFNLSHNKLSSLENCPQSLSGSFSAQNNQLLTIQGGPQSVGGNFNVSGNRLKDLQGGPVNVGNNYFCGNNQLETLEFAPQHINGIFSALDNHLTSLKYGPKIVKVLFLVSNNPLTSLEFAPETTQNIEAIGTELKTLLNCPTKNLIRILLPLNRNIEPYLPPSKVKYAQQNNVPIELNQQEFKLAYEKEYLCQNLKLCHTVSNKIYKI